MVAANMGIEPGQKAHLVRATAYHEAAHVVVAWRFGKRLHEGGVVVNFDRPGEGRTYTPGWLVLPLARLPEEMRAVARRRLRAECMEFLAGYLAERRALGQRGACAMGSDAMRAIMLIMRAHGCIRPIAELHLHVYLKSTRRMIRQPVIWDAIDAIAQRLLERGRLSAAEVAAVFAARALKPVALHHVGQLGNAPAIDRRAALMRHKKK